MQDLRSAVLRKGKSEEKLRKISKSLSEYAVDLAPYLDAALKLFPIGPFTLTFTPAAKAVKKKIHDEKTLVAKKKELDDVLESIDVPIVVIIDEVDRAENEEIKTIAKLVRSVASFPRIAYLIAYDPPRVWTALGNGNELIGRHYLEKIVQLPIPLPAISEAQFEEFLVAEIKKAFPPISVPLDWLRSTRFIELRKYLVSNCLRTPRDIKRCLEIFSVYASMVGEEVDTIDLLAFATLLSKRPDIVEIIKANFERFVANPIAQDEMMALFAEEKLSGEQKFNFRFGNRLEPSDPISPVVSYLFQRLEGKEGLKIDNSEDFVVGHRLSHRPALIAVLRLGWPEGSVNRSDVRNFFSLDDEAKFKFLLERYSDGTFGSWINVFSEMYSEFAREERDHISFWQAFRRLDDYAVKSSLYALRAALHNSSFSINDLLLDWGKRSDGQRKIARAVILEFAEKAPEFSSHWIRKQFFAHGLFSRQKQIWQPQILDAGETIAIANRMADKFLSEHLNRKWVETLTDASAIFLMLDTNSWSASAIEKIIVDLKEPRGLDNFTILMFGPGYSTDPATISKIVDRNIYVQMVKARLDALNLDTSISSLDRNVIQETLIKTLEELSS